MPRPLPQHLPRPEWCLAALLLAAALYVRVVVRPPAAPLSFELYFQLASAFTAGLAASLLFVLGECLLSALSLDARTHAEKTLEAIEAWIENHDPAVAEYEIAGRRMKYIPIDQLLKMRDQYRREVRGVGGKSGRVYLRF